MKIQGIADLTVDQLNFELKRGGQFVFFLYCISLLVVTFRRPSDVYFIRAGENAVVKGLPFTLLSLAAGWWGIPFGPIYTVQSVYTNLRGGKNVTSAVIASLNQPGA
jgi:hypothetical protein